MIKSDAYIQRGLEGQIGLRAMWRVKPWDCDLSGAGKGISIQYGINWLKGSPPSPAPGVSLQHYYAFTPYFAGRMQGPTILVDAWPGGTVRFPSGNVTIEAYIAGGWTVTSGVEPLLWYWSAVSELMPIPHLPTFTEFPIDVEPEGLSTQRVIPHRARSVSVRLPDDTYDTGSWNEYMVDGTNTSNYRELSGGGFGEIQIGGTSHYYRIGNSATEPKTAFCVFSINT